MVACRRVPKLPPDIALTGLNGKTGTICCKWQRVQGHSGVIARHHPVAALLLPGC